MSTKHRVGVIGHGKMGRHWAQEFLKHPKWELAYICDQSEAARQRARAAAPGVRIIDDAEIIFNDPSIEAVGLYTLSDARPNLIRRALKAGKHVMAEKPIAADIATEEALLKEIEASGKLVAVNLFNRNAWYHREIQSFIASGQIGKLGIIRISHQTGPSTFPGEDHQPEGPPFHDCGMHYVDVARWYAGSEYGQWHVQGVRMWDEEKPWWATALGTFKNGIVFEIANGFCYGAMAKDPIVNSSLECIGTHGLARMRHDFATVTLEMHGTSETVHKSGPYGGKNIDVMVDLFVRSMEEGRNLGLPSARDSVIASKISQVMLDEAIAANPPAIGTVKDLEEIRAFRRAKLG